MALGKCRECGKEASNQAKACPHCGATKPVKKNVGLVGIAFAALFGIAVFKCTSDSERVSADLAAKEAAKTPEQRAAEAKAKKADTQRLTAAMELVKVVKENAKDPDSVKFSQIAVNEQGTVVCGIYRAKNSFNAVVPGRVVIYDRKASDRESDWHKHCAKAKDLRDYTYAG